MTRNIFDCIYDTSNTDPKEANDTNFKIRRPAATGVYFLTARVTKVPTNQPSIVRKEPKMAGVNLEDARRVISAAEKKAKEIGQPMNIAVADEGGNIVAHVRMDGAWIGSIDISQKKAYTSRAFDIATKDLATHSQSGGQFFGIHASNNGKIMIFAGGIPLKKDGKVVGAIGVSGGSGEQDHAVAAAGAAAF
jgi:uncharacterized protein GlcG (DUF336 family)